MAALKDNAITLLNSTAAVDFNGAPDAETALYTVPVGKTCIVTHLVIRTLSADALLTVVTFGKTGGTCDELRGNQILSGLDGVTKYTTIYLDQGTNDTPEAAVMFAAGDVLGVEITTAAGAGCTATIDAFGYEF